MSDFTSGQQVKLKDGSIPDISDQMCEDLTYLKGVIGILHKATEGTFDWYFDTDYGAFPVLNDEIEAVQP